MQITIDISDSQLKDLTAICKAENLNFSDIIHQAISNYLIEKNKDIFGL